MARRARLRIWCIGLVLACAPISAGAGPTAGGLSSRLARVPVDVLQRLSSSPELPQFTDELRSLLRDLDQDGTGLDAADVTAAARRALAGARERQLTDAFSFDLDGDGRVGLAEIRTAVESEEAIAAMEAKRSAQSSSHPYFTFRVSLDVRQKAERAALVSRVLALDRNRDDSIDFDEARLLSPETRAAAVKAPVALVQALLSVDPTRDGRLTRDDTTALAQIVFAAFDHHADGTLDDAERAHLARYLPVDPNLVPKQPYLSLGKDPRCLSHPDEKPPCPPE